MISHPLALTIGVVLFYLGLAWVFGKMAESFAIGLAIVTASCAFTGVVVLFLLWAVGS